MKKILILFLIIHFFNNNEVLSQKEYVLSDTTKVVLLGTGNPNPDPDHSGCSVAVVVNDTPYIVDFGPGLIRKAAAVSPKYGGTIEGMDVKNIKRAFLTHLHSDHTTGYPDLILTPWVMGRDEPLEVYGPEGIKKMTDHILEAYSDDIKYRLYGLEPANNEGWKVNTHDIKEGVIYKDDNVTVVAFKVEHGNWPNAFGFRFITPDRVVVISGDTKPCENLIRYSQDADILIHEVYSFAGYQKKDASWKIYHSVNHTSTYELAEIANIIKPGLIILYHTLSWGSSNDEILEEINSRYKGKVVVGSDLDVY